MQTQHPSLIRAVLAGACILAALLSQAAYADSPDEATKPVQAVWKPVEIKYSYVGFTTAYNCDSFEAKVKSILLTLGATPLTRVQANGCVDINDCATQPCGHGGNGSIPFKKLRIRSTCCARTESFLLER